MIGRPPFMRPRERSTNRFAQNLIAAIISTFRSDASAKGSSLNSTPANEHKFHALVTENRDRLLRVCRVYVWNSADQDDLYQEVLLQIWRGLPSLKENQFANTWLYRVAINTAISFVRKRASSMGRVVHFEHADLTRAVESQQAPDGRADDRIADLYSAVTRRIVDLLNAGDYEAVQSIYDSDMSRAMPPAKTFEFFTDLATKYGNIEDFDGPTGDGYLGWTAFRLHCERGELTMSMVLDADGRISGIYFLPTPRPLLNIKTFVLDLFSWQHLMWLPPFVLASVVYTWIVQKTTERAVGISTLGIHLSKGQTLVLWDEIKEVRPMKFLHIKNLWLIKEPGEKTIMHWTPLERHPELKAAVENFAPADHPIRKYLSLLK